MLVLLLALWLGCPSSGEAASGQTASEGPGHVPSMLIRESPLPVRTWFLLLRTGLAARVDPGLPAYYPRSDVHGTLDVGAIRNLSTSSGLGGNVYLGFDDRRTRLGVKARYTQWLSPHLSIDLAPGILFAGGDNWGGSASYPGVVGEVTLSMFGWIHLTAQVESIDIEHPTLPGQRDTSTYVGAQGTGPRGVLAMAGGALAFLAVRGLVYLAQE
jgi:hypothetical protein